MFRSYRSIASGFVIVGAALGLLVGYHSPAVAQNDLTPEQQAAVDRAFTAGTDALTKQKYANAVTEFKKVLLVVPDETSTLWNCGTAAFFAHDYPTSLQCWQRLRPLAARIDSDSPDAKTFTAAKVTAKLIQVYQAMGDRTARNRERAALVQLRASRTDPALTEQDSFCCDQFTVGGKRVFAYDYFALTGRFGVRYDFVVTKPDGTMDYHLQLECGPDDNAMAHETKEIKPNQRLFSLDGYYDRGRLHRTFVYFSASAPKLSTDPKAPEPSPAYEAVKAVVIRVIQGKVPSLTSSYSGKP